MAGWRQAMRFARKKSSPGAREAMALQGLSPLLGLGRIELYLNVFFVVGLSQTSEALIRLSSWPLPFPQASEDNGANQMGLRTR